MSVTPEDIPSPRPPEQVAVHIAIRLAALFLLIYLSLTLVQPFTAMLLWSVILTVATQPLFVWLKARLGGRGTVAAVVLTTVLVVLLIGPIAALSSNLVISLERLADGIQENGLTLPALPSAIANLPYVGGFIEQNWALVSADLPGYFKEYQYLFVRPREWLLKIVEGLAASVSSFALAIIISGFFQNSAPVLAGYARTAALRMAGPHGQRFAALTGMTIKNVAQGIIGIAIVQAILIGVALMALMALMAFGVPHAGLLAAIALVLAITQIGAGLLMGPLILWFWFTKDWTSALPFTLAMVPIYALESIGKPIVMSRGLGTPMFVILIGVLGGTVVYGLPGLFIGPIVLAVLYELLFLWIKEDEVSEIDNAGGGGGQG